MPRKIIDRVTNFFFEKKDITDPKEHYKFTLLVWLLIFSCLWTNFFTIQAYVSDAPFVLILSPLLNSILQLFLLFMMRQFKQRQNVKMIRLIPYLYISVSYLTTSIGILNSGAFKSTLLQLWILFPFLTVYLTTIRFSLILTTVSWILFTVLAVNSGYVFTVVENPEITKKMPPLEFMMILSSYMSICLGVIYELIRRGLYQKIEENERVIASKNKIISIGQNSTYLAHKLNNPITILVGKMGIVLKKTSAANPNMEELKEALLKLQTGLKELALQVSENQAVTTFDELEVIKEISVDQIIDLISKGTKEHLRLSNFSCEFHVSYNGPIYCLKTHVVQSCVLIINGIIKLQSNKENRKLDIFIQNEGPNDNIGISIKVEKQYIVEIDIDSDEFKKIFDFNFIDTTLSTMGGIFEIKVEKNIISFDLNWKNTSNSN